MALWLNFGFNRHASFSEKLASTKKRGTKCQQPTNLTITTKTMKTQEYKKWTKALLILLLSFGFLGLDQAEAKSYPGVSFQTFYDELTPYGDWVQDRKHGYIWLPYAEQGFHPYGSNGHWAMTSYGNTWVSYYDWGWAPFHYGRWYFDNFYQSWAWVPDYEWGPAWVNWRSGGGYYGWAPLAPGFSINIGGYLPSSYFVFVPRHRIYHHYAHNYYAPYGHRARIYNQTTIINNTVVYNNNHYVAGPTRREIERVTKRSVPVYQVQASDRAGRTNVSRNSISLYRPDLETTRSRNAQTQARPSRLLEADEARSARRQAAEESLLNSSRSANPGTLNSNAPASRSDRGSLRSNPNVQESPSFETRPYEDSRSRTSAPSRGSQAIPQEGNSRSRSANPATVRTSPEVHQNHQNRIPSARPEVRYEQRQRTQNNFPEVRQSESQRSEPTQPVVRSAPQQRSNPDVGRSSRSTPINSRVNAPSSPHNNVPSRVNSAPSRGSSSTSTSRSSTGRTVLPGGN
jgi:hypothetical protein